MAPPKLPQLSRRSHFWLPGDPLGREPLEPGENGTGYGHDDADKNPKTNEPRRTRRFPLVDVLCRGQSGPMFDVVWAVVGSDDFPYMSSDDADRRAEGPAVCRLTAHKLARRQVRYEVRVILAQARKVPHRFRARPVSDAADDSEPGVVEPEVNVRHHVSLTRRQLACLPRVPQRNTPVLPRARRNLLQIAEVLAVCRQSVCSQEAAVEAAGSPLPAKPDAPPPLTQAVPLFSCEHVQRIGVGLQARVSDGGLTRSGCCLRA